MNIKQLSKIFNRRTVIYITMIVAVLATIGFGTTHAFAQSPDESVETTIYCGGEVTDSNGAGHVTRGGANGTWEVKNGYLVWTRADVSAGQGGYGQNDAVGNCVGQILPNLPIKNQSAPRDLVTNELLEIVLQDNGDGTMTIVSVTPTGETGTPKENGGITILLFENPTDGTATDESKKGFRCKATGNGYQLNEVSTSADQSGFFVEVDTATLETWAGLNGYALNEVQSDFCGLLDPNVPEETTVADSSAASNLLETTIITTDITLESGVTITSDGTGDITVTDENGEVIASDTDGIVTVDEVTISVPVNGTVTQPADANGAGSGGSTTANGHEGETLVCEVNNGGNTVCKWVKP